MVINLDLETVVVHGAPKLLTPTAKPFTVTKNIPGYGKVCVTGLTAAADPPSPKVHPVRAAVPVLINESVRQIGGVYVKLIVSVTVQFPVSGGGHLLVSTVMELEVLVQPNEFVTTTENVVAAFINGEIDGVFPDGVQANE